MHCLYTLMFIVCFSIVSVDYEYCSAFVANASCTFVALFSNGSDWLCHSSNTSCTRFYWQLGKYTSIQCTSSSYRLRCGIEFGINISRKCCTTTDAISCTDDSNEPNHSSFRKLRNCSAAAVGFMDFSALHSLAHS